MSFINLEYHNPVIFCTDVESLILILCDFVLQFDLSDIRDRLHGLSEDKMTGYHYHKYVSKFVVDLLNGTSITGFGKTNTILYSLYMYYL